MRSCIARPGLGVRSFEDLAHDIDRVLDDVGDEVLDRSWAVLADFAR